MMVKVSESNLLKILIVDKPETQEGGEILLAFFLPLLRRFRFKGLI